MQLDHTLIIIFGSIAGGATAADFLLSRKQKARFRDAIYQFWSWIQIASTKEIVTQLTYILAEANKVIFGRRLFSLQGICVTIVLISATLYSSGLRYLITSDQSDLRALTSVFLVCGVTLGSLPVWILSATLKLLRSRIPPLVLCSFLAMEAIAFKYESSWYAFWVVGQAVSFKSKLAEYSPIFQSFWVSSCKLVSREECAGMVVGDIFFTVILGALMAKAIQAAINLQLTLVTALFGFVFMMRFMRRLFQPIAVFAAERIYDHDKGVISAIGIIFGGLAAGIKWLVDYF